MTTSSQRIRGAVRNWHAAAIRRRLLMLLLVTAQTAGATYIMLGVLPYQGSTLLEQGLLVLFAVLFGWISIGFWMATFGFVIRRLGGDSRSLLARYPPAWLDNCKLAPTAVVFPIYHEDVQRTFAGVRETYRDLAATGRLEAFEFFILSDSRDPDVWLEEQTAWYRLCEELGAHGRLHYRRRGVNLNRKTGNIADFLRRWGKRYTYMIVMDADSLVGGGDLVRMVQLMQAAPQVGILQTSPRIVNAGTAYARLQQFGNHLYGPLFTAGLASLQLGDAVFWGHNAVIRVAPFMQHCGLRRLTGRGFLGGNVLSHDFIEAAFIRRAGYEVWLEPELAQSYEESPPTLIDDLTRDRRWAYGNLQHLYFLFRPGMRLAHRFAFVQGIMAYLTSPLWFLFLVLATAEVTQFILWPVDYFPESHQLHPLWPQWQPQWALRLVSSVLFVLFMPKLLAVIDLVLDRPRLRAMGGTARILLSAGLELLLSVLLAPIRMLAHSRFVVETLFNLEVQWAGQNRTEELRWGAALRHHAPGSLLALGWAGFAFWLKPLFVFWSLPIALPLIFAAPISVWLSRFRNGLALRRSRLMLAPEESRLPAVLTRLEHPVLPEADGLSPFELAIVDPWRNTLHRKLARRSGDLGGRREIRTALVEQCRRGGPQTLERWQRDWLAQDAPALQRLHEAVWSADAPPYWQQVIACLCRSPALADTGAQPRKSE